MKKTIAETRYDSIHRLSANAKKDARARVIDALVKHFQGEDKAALVKQDIENAVQYLASTNEDDHVTNWYMVTIRVYKSDQAAFRWHALFLDWKRRMGGKQ